MLSTETQNLMAKFVNPTILDHADLKSLIEQDTLIVSLIEAYKIKVSR